VVFLIGTTGFIVESPHKDLPVASLGVVDHCDVLGVFGWRTPQ
jgi:hypothetical protein